MRAIPYWFAPNISIHETGESQFCEQGRMQQVYCSNSKNFGKPVLGYPAGYGMMQLDPASVDQIWNWQTNVSGGQGKLDAFAGNSNDSGNLNDIHAYQVWYNQVRNWRQYNADPKNANRLAPPPMDDSEGVPGSTCTFVGNIDLATNQTAPTSNQSSTHWFGDAILMRQYAAGFRPPYITFVVDPKTNMGSWSINAKTKLVFRDKSGGITKTLYPLPVWEFCTCSSASTCQNSSPQ